QEAHMPSPLTGGCLCGAIRYTIAVPITELRACHCRSCQKVTGAAGSINAVIPSAAFTLTQGTPKRYSARADSGRTLNRYFCGDCGSPIYSPRVEAPETMAGRGRMLDASVGVTRHA